MAMKAKDLREKTEAELMAQAQDLRAEAFNLRLQQTSGQLEKPSRIRDVRREVARIETVLNEKVRAARSKV